MEKYLAIALTTLIILSPLPFLNNTQAIQTNDLPHYFSWTNINGVDYTTEIKNQAPAPTCESYALCASLETLMQYKLQEIYNPDLSETHLFFYAGGSYKEGYVKLTDAANYLKEYGVPDEGCNPDPHRPFDYQFESLQGWENRTVKITSWGWVAHDIESIKTALIEHGPLIICISLWRDFYYYLGGVYKHRWGNRIGGHVVAMVGYDDSKECWIVKNSWGSSWGAKGWFRMSYDANMFAKWYGNGTGIMYIDGVYGNLKPDVPKVDIKTPRYSHSYIFGLEFKTIFKNIDIQKAAARIFGKMTVKVNAENANSVEFFIDNVSQHIDDEVPFTWNLKTTKGLHTLEVRAYNDYNTSIDFTDVYVFF